MKRLLLLVLVSAATLQAADSPSAWKKVNSARATSLLKAFVTGYIAFRAATLCYNELSDNTGKSTVFDATRDWWNRMSLENADRMGTKLVRFGGMGFVSWLVFWEHFLPSVNHAFDIKS